MMFPKKVKYRKWHTMRHNPDKPQVETRGTEVSFGSFGLKALAGGRIRSNQIEAARKVLARSAGKAGKVWIRMPYTGKPPEVGMGKGKGDPHGYCFEVKAGRVVFEVDGIDAILAKEALRKAGTKLPVKSKVIAR